MESSREPSRRMILVYVAVLLVAACVFSLAGFFVGDANSAVFKDRSVLRWLSATALLSLTVAIAGVSIASAVGYLSARSPLLRRRSGFGGAFLIQVGPAGIVLAGLCSLLFWLRLVEPWLALYLIYLVTGLPFCLWQMIRSYRAIPVEMEEAAELDGASVGHSFFEIVLPLVLRALVVTGLFSLVLAWIEYVIAGLLLRNSRIFPLPVAPAAVAFGSETVAFVAIAAVTLFLFLSCLLAVRSNRAETGG